VRVANLLAGVSTFSYNSKGGFSGERKTLTYTIAYFMPTFQTFFDHRLNRTGSARFTVVFPSFTIYGLT
jgi:hypothetical protein